MEKNFEFLLEIPVTNMQPQGREELLKDLVKTFGEDYITPFPEGEPLSEFKYIQFIVLAKNTDALDKMISKYDASYSKIITDVNSIYTKTP